jgi:hypothetical protein
VVAILDDAADHDLYDLVVPRRRSAVPRTRPVHLRIINVFVGGATHLSLQYRQLCLQLAKAKCEGYRTQHDTHSARVRSQLKIRPCKQQQQLINRTQTPFSSTRGLCKQSNSQQQGLNASIKKPVLASAAAGARCADPTGLEEGLHNFFVHSLDTGRRHAPGGPICHGRVAQAAGKGAARQGSLGLRAACVEVKA